MSAILPAALGHGALKNQLQRALEQGRLPHCMVFAGPKGVGKSTMALALAQGLLCTKNHGTTLSACGKCYACVSTKNKQNPALLWRVQTDSTKIHLAVAKELMGFFGLKAMGQAQVCVLGPAEDILPQATNALLKLLEQLPAKSYVVLISHNLSRVLSTLRSRAITLRFGPVATAPGNIAESAAGRATTAPSPLQQKSATLLAQLVSTPQHQWPSLLWSDEVQKIAPDKPAHLQLVAWWQSWLSGAVKNKLDGKSTNPMPAHPVPAYLSSPHLSNSLNSKTLEELLTLCTACLRLEQQIQKNLRPDICYPSLRVQKL